MSSWLTYTAVPAPESSLQDLLDALAQTRLRNHREVAYPEHNVVSAKVRSSANISKTEIRQAFTDAIASLHILYFTRVNDTTDAVTIEVLEPTCSGQLGVVEERSGELLFEDRDEYEDRFDERAAAVREWEDSRRGIYSDEDHVTDLQAQYRGRPLFHYS